MIKFSGVFLLFLVSVWTVSAGPAKPSIGGRIIGGAVARVAQFPYQVAIYIDTIIGKFFCGGSLVNRQWILTAAHCLYNGRMYTLYIGSNTLQGGDPNRIIIASSTSVSYPSFNVDTLENDIGLIKIHMPLELNDYIQPIVIASLGDINEGAPALAAGWGQVEDATAGIVNDLYYTTVVVISSRECQATYGDQIKTTMICAAGNYNEGICTGDTGGPLIVTKGNAQIQIGVASFFSGQGCETFHPSGYTRVDFYEAWITNVTSDVDY